MIVTCTCCIPGLRFSRSSFPSTPLETRSGTYIYDGAPSTYHDWEFRTSMRLKLYEDAIRSNSKKAKCDAKSIDPDGSDDDSRAEEANPTRAAAALVPSEDRPDMDATTPPGDRSGSPARPRASTQKSDDWGSAESITAALPMDESSPYAVKARTEMVHRVLEGLRDEAFELARDIGIESLPAPGGLRNFITQMRNVVFPALRKKLVSSFVRANGTCSRTPRQRVNAVAHQPTTTMVEITKVLRLWHRALEADAGVSGHQGMHLGLPEFRGCQCYPGGAL